MKKIKYYISLIRGKTQAKNPAKLSFRNILAVIQAFIRKHIPIPRHIYEQIIWRRTEVMRKSPECWETGHCVQCGCEILGKTMEDRACENPPYCYPNMMGKTEWNKYKQINNIKLFEEC